MNSLHDKILNIPFINRVFNKKEEKTAYRLGHHDARHAAVEIAIEEDELNHELLMMLEEILADYKLGAEELVDDALDYANELIPRVETLIAKAKGHKNDK